MRVFREQLGIVMIAAIFILSFFAINAAQYDTAEHLWLTLLAGVAILLLPLFFGIKGITRNPGISLLLGGWILFVWISFYFSQTKNYGFSEAVVLTFAALLGIFVCTLSHYARSRILTMLWIFAVIAALYGFWYFPTHAETRMAGLFFDSVDPRHFFPNAFANFLLMTWPVGIIGMGHEGRGMRKNIFRTLGIACLLAALYLTYSRGAWAAFGIQIIILLFTLVRASRARIKKIFTGVMITTVAAALFTVGLIALRSKNFATLSFGEKVTFQNSELVTSVSERADFWKASPALIKEHPLVGSGPMSFRYVFPRYQKIFLGTSDHPHNWILKIAIENGLPAAIFFILFLGVPVITIVRGGERHSELALLGAGLIGGLVHNFVDFNFNFIPTIMVFFILAGCVMAYRPAHHENKIGRTLAVALWTVLIFITALFSIRELQTTLALRANPDDTASYKASLAPRDFFRTEAEKSLHKGNTSNAKKLLAVHLEKNQYDAFAQFLAGNPERALAADPMNRFAYYRLYLEKNQRPDEKIKDQLSKLLAGYDEVLANNLHYTTFTDNPEEAARIYEILGNSVKAAEVRTHAREIRKEYAAKNQFNKQLAPRTLIELVRQKFVH